MPYHTVVAVHVVPYSTVCVIPDVSVPPGLSVREPFCGAWWVAQQAVPHCRLLGCCMSSVFAGVPGWASRVDAVTGVSAFPISAQRSGSRSDAQRRRSWVHLRAARLASRSVVTLHGWMLLAWAGGGGMHMHAPGPLAEACTTYRPLARALREEIPSSFGYRSESTQRP